MKKILRIIGMKKHLLIVISLLFVVLSCSKEGEPSVTDPKNTKEKPQDTTIEDKRTEGEKQADNLVGKSFVYEHKASFSTYSEDSTELVSFKKAILNISKSSILRKSEERKDTIINVITRAFWDTKIVFDSNCQCTVSELLKTDYNTINSTKKTYTCEFVHSDFKLTVGGNTWKLYASSFWQNNTMYILNPVYTYVNSVYIFNSSIEEKTEISVSKTNKYTFKVKDDLSIIFTAEDGTETKGYIAGASIIWDMKSDGKEIIFTKQ